MPLAADLPPVSAMVTEAEQNERKFNELSVKWEQLAHRASKSLVRQTIETWNRIHKQVAQTVHDQTEIMRRAAEWYKAVSSEYERMRQRVEMAEREYTDLYSRFVDRLAEAQAKPSDENLRQVMIGFQLMKAQHDGMEARLGDLEKGVVPEAKGRIEKLSEALIAESEAKHKVFWYTAGMAVGPAIVVFVFWLSRV